MAHPEEAYGHHADRWQILGIHGDVARVRMFLGDEIIDEDFPLPKLPKTVPPSELLYDALLEDTVDARMKTLNDKAIESTVERLRSIKDGQE